MPSITSSTQHRRLRLSRPNVVLILTDDQEIGTDASDVMPYLASQPQGNWVSFPRSVVTSPLCGISRATLLTGQRWQRHGVNGHGLAALSQLDETATIPVRLQAAGYRTGIFGKYMNLFPWGEAPYIPPGWDSFWCEIDADLQNYYSWTYYSNISGAKTAGTTDDTDFVVDRLAGYADTFIRNPDGRPWFAMLTPIAPHAPAQWPTRHAGLSFSPADPPDWDQPDLTGYPAYMQAQPRMPQLRLDRSRSTRVQTRRTLRSVDEMIATVMAALTATGQLNNTVVIVMTDNSNAYGRKRSMSDDANYQKRVPYHYSVSALLKVRYPGATQRTDQALVASVDVPTSILSWAGGSWTHPVDGSTRLADWVLGLGGKRPSVEMTYPKYPSSSPIPSWNSVITDAGQKYVEYPETGEHERFDTIADPYEMAPLYGTNNTLETSLSATLASHMADPLWWGS